jgi:uncharacterized protein (TIGR00661 family)
VDIFSTVTNALRMLSQYSKIEKRVVNIIEEFDPDIILTGYEFFTALAAEKLGVPCVSVDHIHVVSHCKYSAPRSETLNRLMTRSSIRLLYSKCSRYLVFSFFDVLPINPKTTRVLPLIVRNAVLKAKPTEKDHVLIYQTSPTFHRLFPILNKIDSKFLIYGLGARQPEKNLVFKPNSIDGFLEDLASSRYVISNGGHGVISEALCLGKPIISFPIKNAYEQFLNAYFVSRCGYGEYSTSSAPSTSLFENFEKQLDQFRINIGKSRVIGNSKLLRLLESFINKPQNLKFW